jgi:hypothetical protein
MTPIKALSFLYSDSPGNSQRVGLAACPTQQCSTFWQKKTLLKICTIGFVGFSEKFGTLFLPEALQRIQNPVRQNWSHPFLKKI